MKTHTNQTNLTSVYRNQNVFIRAVFQRAGDTTEVLCVALDYAKRHSHQVKPNLLNNNTLQPDKT